jgi:hypothetical protein
MTVTRAWIICALSVLVPIGQAVAHHSFAAEYDANKVIELKGVVTKMEWTNPHVRFYMDVRDEKGVSSWDLELQSANTLTRDGWDRDALKVGDQITVSAWLARDGSKRGNARGSITLADGRQVLSGERQRAAGEEVKR